MWAFCFFVLTWACCFLYIFNIPSYWLNNSFRIQSIQNSFCPTPDLYYRKSQNLYQKFICRSIDSPSAVWKCSADYMYVALSHQQITCPLIQPVFLRWVLIKALRFFIFHQCKKRQPDRNHRWFFKKIYDLNEY